MSCDIKKLLRSEPVSSETKNVSCPRQIRIDRSLVWGWDFFFSPFVSHLGRILTQVGKYLETHAGDKALYLIKDFVGGIN